MNRKRMIWIVLIAFFMLQGCGKKAPPHPVKKTTVLTDSSCQRGMTLSLEKQWCVK
jgi:PBP1b-binding outer membrane lipoprotein LpoB